MSIITLHSAPIRSEDVREFVRERIALATINRVDILASWNFKLIVNFDRIKGYNSVNYRLGYPMIEIRSPKDLLHYED